MRTTSVPMHPARPAQDTAPPTWEPPLPFHQFTLPTFPTETFPDWLRAFVESEAEATQTPPDLAAMLVLGALATACAKRVEISTRAGWVEPLNLYLLVALPPANRKSGVFREIVKPIQAHERALVEQLLPNLAEDETNSKILEERLAHVRAKAARADLEQRLGLEDEARELARQLAETAVPVLPRFLADDVSPEKLASLMAEQGGRIAVLSAEGDIFDLMGGRYSTSNQVNLGIYLKGHAGDELRVDRMGRHGDYIAGPALTIGVTVQPDVLRGLVSRPGFRGRGLLGRFLYAVPESPLGRRRIDPDPVPEHVERRYQQGLHALLELEQACDIDGSPLAHRLRLSESAHELFKDYQLWIEPQLAEDGPFSLITDWAGKLAGAVLRIAGLLHLAANVDDPMPWQTPVSLRTMEHAIAIGDYLVAHARAAFAEMGADAEVEDARRVLRWIERKGCDSFSKRDVYEGTKGHFKKVTALEPVLKLLVQHGYIRERATIDASRPGRKPSPIFDVNPLFLSGLCQPCREVEIFRAVVPLTTDADASFDEWLEDIA